MTRPVICLSLLALFAFGFAPEAQGQRVHRCIDAEGRPLFSDQPCVAHNARRPEDPVPPTAAEVAAAEAREAERLKRMGYCPAWDAESLQTELEASFGARDVNRLAALYHWPGATKYSSTVVLNEMERLLKRPLLDVDEEAAELPLDWEPGDPEPLPRLRLELGSEGAMDDPLFARFAVVRHAGCIWITWAGIELDGAGADAAYLPYEGEAD